MMNIPKLPSRTINEVGLSLQSKLLGDFVSIEQELQSEEERKDSFFKIVSFR